MNKTNIGLAVLCTALMTGAFFLGGYSANQTAKQTNTGEPRNLEEIVRLEGNFNQTQSDLVNRVADIQNQIKTTKLNLGLGKNDSAIESVELAQRLAELDGEIATATAARTSSTVPVPIDSPDGKVLNQPRTASGIQVNVLRNHERATGVSPEEVEELMQRKN